MKKTEEKLLKFIGEKKLIEKDDKILVALSGGPDSVFLFHFLLKFKKKFRISIGAVHVNHRLRGEYADADEKFCINLCEHYSVPLHLISKDVKRFSKKNKISLEEAGRDIRYREFQIIAKKFNYSKIATAHNCNDNSETVLLNLVKGTGISGLSGIPYKRGNIIRPVLPAIKDEILSYLSEMKLQFRIDQSNYSNDYERNFVRNELFPLIKSRLNPAVDEKIFNASEILKRVKLQVDKVVNEELKNITKFEKNQLKVRLSSAKNFEEDISRDIFKAAIEQNFKIFINFHNLDDLNHLLQKVPGSRIHLQENLEAVKERKEIIIYKRTDEVEDKSLEIKPGNSVKISGRKFSINQCKNVPKKFPHNRNIEYINGDTIKGNFEIRRWKKGDRFQPIGFKGTKKISDFLAEQKISSSVKKKQLLLTNDGKIVWVIGLRMDERYKIVKNVQKVYELCLK